MEEESKFEILLKKITEIYTKAKAKTKLQPHVPIDTKAKSIEKIKREFIKLAGVLRLNKLQVYYSEVVSLVEQYVIAIPSYILKDLKNVPKTKVSNKLNKKTKVINSTEKISEKKQEAQKSEINSPSREKQDEKEEKEETLLNILNIISDRSSSHNSFIRANQIEREGKLLKKLYKKKPTYENRTG
jgi:hypothetical protein